MPTVTFSTVVDGAGSTACKDTAAFLPATQNISLSAIPFVTLCSILRFLHFVKL